MTGLGGKSTSVGRIVFATLLCMSLGAAAIGFVAIYGIQSFRQEFERLIEADLPQTTIATQLNAEVSGLTGQVGLLLTAQSEIALSTFRIQIRDQLDAIDRQKTQLRSFNLRPGEYADLEDTLSKLVDNIHALTALKIRNLRSENAFRALKNEIRDITDISTETQSFLAWSQRVEATTRIQQITPLTQTLNRDIAAGHNELGAELLDLRRAMLEIETVLQGRLNQHMLLSAQLTDATRYMSSRLISEANARSSSIQSLIQTNLYVILACFLAFATVGAFIYIYLDRNVVGRIQNLTRLMTGYEGRAAPTLSSANEIDQLETSFAKLTEVIAERENRLVALNETATGARREAEKANRSKSTLLAAASHDLRQPIHAMGLLIGGINRSELSKKSRETVDQLAGLTLETVRLFNSILDLSKLEAGTFTATNTPVDLKGVLTRIAAEFQPRAPASGSKLTVALPDRSLFVTADEDALYRILSNLVVNAITYATAVDVFADCSSDNQTCSVIVSDNGPGLKTGPNTTAPKDNASKEAGYGLGLSISFALAAAMQTELSSTSPLTGGTRFVLPLPLGTAPEAAPAESRPIERSAKPLSGTRIIFLEDDVAVHLATRDDLARLGCMVTACKTAKEATEAIAAAAEPFILISDVNLGRGYSANGIIAQALADSPHLSAAIVTTATRLDSNTPWHNQPNVHILNKPFSIGRLASLLRHLANAKQAASPAQPKTEQ